MGKTQNLFKRLLNPDLVLLEEELFDEKGQLRLYHPVTQQCLFDLIKDQAIVMLKEQREEAKKAKKEKN